MGTAVKAPFKSNWLLKWIDWNIDGDFEDADELIYKSGPLRIMTSSTTILPLSMLKFNRNL
jgi:hypothetical protein